MRINSVLAVFSGLLLSVPTFSQNRSVSVNNYTGAANISFPINNVTSGSLSLPVAVVYQGGGVKVKDVRGEMGMDWHLIAGGEVSRRVRGLPDDQKKDGSYLDRLGWLYNTNGTKINSFTIANDNNSSVCTDETSDNNYITTNFSDLSDTEPDEFSIDAPGLSCKFVFDAAHTIKVFPYQDVKITYTTDSNGKITSFTVVNDKGITYTFAEQEQVLQTILASGTPGYFKRFYDQYKNGMIFNRSWKLTHMVDESGGEIILNYITGSPSFYMKPVTVVLPGATTPTLQYRLRTSMAPKLISQVIKTADGDLLQPVLSFGWSNNLLSNISGMGRSAGFSYYYRTSGGAPITGSDRAFMINLGISGGGVNKSYRFDYSGTTFIAGGGISLVDLPDSTSTKQDYWGYYNGSSATTLVPQVYTNPSNAAMERYRFTAPGSASSSFPYTLAGADRSPNITYAVNGSLSKISSNDKDTTYIEYELHNYYDPTTGTVANGGGIRVKKITAFDGYNPANNIVSNYSYLDPATGQTSGRPITLPIYAFTTPYTGSGTTEAKWASSTVRSDNDLSEEDETIVYKNVAVSRTGSGSVRYEYTVPGTYKDASALPDWAPTVYNSGRIACTTASFANNQTNNYPFGPNPNFDFERGLLKKMSTYNDAGQQTSEETYTYQRSFPSSVVVTGFKFDDNTTSARNYAKYSILTGTSELLIQQTKKVFDLPALTTNQISTVNYNYASTAHKLLTSTETTNSDGSVVKSFIKYVKDYSTSLGTDSMANSLYRLKQRNVNIPIEQYQQVQRTAGTVTTSASLTMYKNFLSNWVSDKPSQSLQLVSANGISNFQPSAIVSNAFTRDSRYIIKGNYLAYDAYGNLQSSDDNRHRLATVLTNTVTMQPAATFTNALESEIAFEDFESSNQGGHFTYSDTTWNTNTHSGKRALTIKPTSVFTRTIARNPLAGSYIFSVWINSTASGTLTVRLTDGTLTYNYPLNYTSTSGLWKYYEIKTALSNLASSFTIKIIPGTNILVDDLLFYPEQTTVNTTGFDRDTYLKTSETNTNGVSAYYSYDTHGRLKLVYDQDKNIVMKKSYAEFNAYNEFNADFTAQLTGSDSLNYNNPILFRNINQPDIEGTKWTWNFGDGTPSVVSTKVDTITNKPGNQIIYNAVNHTFTQKGDYSVSLTKFSPMPGNKTVTKVIHITDHSSRPVQLSASIAPSYAVQLVRFNGTGGDISYTRSQIEFGGTTVPEGVYQVTVNTTGTLYNPSTGNGFKSVYIQVGRNIVGCSNYNSSSNVYNFYGIDLNGATSVGVSFSNQACSAILPPIEIQ